MSRPEQQADLVRAAEEELERAITLTARELSQCTPWGDSYEGFTPAGRSVVFERNYLWASQAGGDICVEVVVYLPKHYESGVRLTRTIPQEDLE